MTTDSTRGNLALGILAGIAATIVAAIVWGLISATTHFQIGYMAIGVGFVVAFAMRFAGRGHDARFAYAAAIISLAGCLIGNYLTACFNAAFHDNLDAFAVVIRLLPRFVDVMTETFSPMDLVFYAIGAYFGFKYTITPPGRQQSQMITETPAPEPAATPE